METTVTEKLTNIINEVKDSSFYEKTHIQSRSEQEEIINNFLDRINDFKAKLNLTTSNIDHLTTEFEELTWFTNLSQEELKKLNDVIASSKDLRSVLIKSFVSYSSIKKRGIAKDEINKFKLAIDAFTEAYKDLESVFFFLPQDEEFQKISRKFSDL